MFNNVIFDAVRVSRSESQSALPNAPVAEYREAEPRGVRFNLRLAASGGLRRLADLLEPAQRPLTEPSFSPDPSVGC